MPIGDVRTELAKQQPLLDEMAGERVSLQRSTSELITDTWWF